MTTILQLLPADAWRAALVEYVYDEGPELWAEPLVGWALVEDVIDDGEVYRSMAGMMRLPGDPSCIVPCCSIFREVRETGRWMRFLGYLKPGEGVEQHRKEAESSYAKWRAQEEEDRALFGAGWTRNKGGSYRWRWESPDGRVMSKREALQELRQGVV